MYAATQERKQDTEIKTLLRGRYSCRHYEDKPVSEGNLRDILQTAGYAPSGANIQPWRVIAISGAVQKKLSDDMVTAFNAGTDAYSAGYQYYSEPLSEKFAARRDAFGQVFYGALGIDRSDVAARTKQTAKNFRFFGAPAALIFTIDRSLAIGSWLDYGMFVQNVMLAARAYGLETCPQESIARLHKVIRRHLPIPDDEIVVIGMSVGYADHAATPQNARQARQSVSEFTDFIGFPTKSGS